jgi:hypothetical protein
MQAVQLPSKEAQKQSVAAAAAQLVKQAVMNQAPASKVTPIANTGPLSTLTSKVSCGGKPSIVDDDIQAPCGLLNQNMLDKVCI